MRVALAVLSCALLLPPQQRGASDAVALELETRRLALAGSCAEVAQRLASSDGWPGVVACLDAVRRGRAPGGLGGLGGSGGFLAGAHARPDGCESLAQAVRARVDDEHPNVRAAALEALVALGTAAEGTEPIRDAPARARAEKLPLVRRAWVRWLAQRPGAASALLALAADADPGVARDARWALVAHAERTEEQVLARCRALVAGSDESGLLELALALERNGATPRLLIKLAGVCEAGFGGDTHVQRSWSAVFHAVTLRLHKFVAPHGLAFPHVIVGGWLGHGTPAARDPRRRALMLRAARLGGAGLAEGLVHAAAAAGDADERGAYLDGAVESLDPQSLVNGALALADLGTEVRLELWQRLRGRARRWSFDETRAWLGTSDVALRTAVVAAIGVTFADHGDAESARLLELALADPEAELALQAFRDLCGGGGLEQRLAALHAAWAARPDPERFGAWLAALPRAAPLAPFRDDLLAAGAERARRGALVELLGAFEGDAGVVQALRGWASEELARLRDTGASADRSEELVAVACLRALVRADAEAPRLLQEIVAGLLAELEHAGAATRDALVGVGKFAVMWLGKSAEGRAALAGLLDEGVPSRLRVEAALALAPQGDERAAAWIARDYAGCDDELRVRCLRALGEAHDAGSLAFLQGSVGDDGEQVRDPGNAPFEITEAVQALVRRARETDGTPSVEAPRIEATLVRLAQGAWDPDVRRLALEELGHVATEAGVDYLFGVAIAASEALSTPGIDELSRERALLDREATLVGWLRLQPPERQRVVLAPWTWPLREGESILRTRLAGERLPPIEFSWRAEIEAARVCARLGVLAIPLAGSGSRPECLDARLVLAYGHVDADVGAPSPAAAELLRMGWIGLLGEPEREDTAALELAARARLFALAEAREEWGTCAALAAGLLDDWRLGRVDERAFAQAFGDFDPRLGEDGPARIAAAALQARACEALASGDPARADDLAQRARAAVGFSRAALDAQDRLERRLEDAR